MEKPSHPVKSTDKKTGQTPREGCVKRENLHACGADPEGAAALQQLEISDALQKPVDVRSFLRETSLNN